MKHLLLEIKKTVAKARADGKTRLDKVQIKEFEQKYREIIAKGIKKNPEYPCRRKRKKRTKAQNLLRRLEAYMREILAFMYDFDVPFDNNLAASEAIYPQSANREAISSRLFEPFSTEIPWIF